jgi:anti-repressor protein
MNELIKVNIKNENGKLLVGSRDIAIGLEKEHKDVLRKIEDVLTVGEFSEREFMTSQGNRYKEYLLDKNAFILLVMNYTGYNDFKRAYIKKFDDMEKRLRLNVPQTYPEALRMYADEVERRELAEKEAQKAIREKSWIGSRRTMPELKNQKKKSRKEV